MAIRKMTSNGLISIEKCYIVKNVNTVIPSEISNMEAEKYYYRFYNVKKISQSAMLVTFNLNYEYGMKTVSFPRQIKIKNTYVNIHIPKEIQNEFNLEYWKINKSTNYNELLLTSSNKQLYMRERLNNG